MNPEAPWLTKDANKLLSSLLRKSDIGIEFGSGRSTPWLASRVSFLISVEHDMCWYNKVKNIMDRKGLNNFELLFFEQDQPKEKGHGSKYLSVFERFTEESLDFIFIDGIYRGACASLAPKFIKPGGLIILDDAQWYLPSNSVSLFSRSHKDGPASDDWEGFLRSVCNWRCIWTSDKCLHDTAIFIKANGR
jgi:predicted O-methyltransferase YrrM